MAGGCSLSAWCVPQVVQMKFGTAAEPGRPVNADGSFRSRLSFTGSQRTLSHDQANTCSVSDGFAAQLSRAGGSPVVTTYQAASWRREELGDVYEKGEAAAGG